MLAKRLLIGLAVPTVSTVLAAAAVTGCSGTSSLPFGLNSAVNSVASQAASAAASALAAVKDAVDATADVRTGPASTDSSGRTVARLTVTNPTSDQHDYTVSVAFEDAAGNLLDAVVVSVSAVPAHG